MVLLVGGAARCSSSSGSNVVAETDDASDNSSSSGTSSGSTSSGASSSGTSSGSTSSGASSGGTSSGTTVITDASVEIEASADGGCPSQSTVTEAAHITMQVSFPSSAASNAGSGTVNIWLLSTLNGGNSFTGTSRSCGTTLPDLELNALGSAAVCAPGKTCGTKVQLQITQPTWDSITRTFALTGTQTGYNVGDTVTTNPALGLLGLAQSSSYSSAATAWPNVSGCATNCTPNGVFMASDLAGADDDKDGNPGITVNPKSDPCTGGSAACTYTYPPTTISLFSIPPLANKVFIASRNQIALKTTRTSCTESIGTATVSLFDNHVVACTIASPAGACSSDQVAFLDDNRTIYGPQPVPSGCASGTNPCVASPTNPISGAVKTVQVAADTTCDQVVSMLPAN